MDILGDAREPVDNQIPRLMNVLLSSQTDVWEKQRVMREEFHIAMTTRAIQPSFLLQNTVD